MIMIVIIFIIAFSFTCIYEMIYEPISIQI